LKIAILVIVYLLVFLFDSLNVYKTGNKAEIIFYALAYCCSFIVLFLYCLDIHLPSVPMYIVKIGEQVYQLLGWSSFLS
jgi:hypothetical protein